MVVRTFRSATAGLKARTTTASGGSVKYSGRADKPRRRKVMHSGLFTRHKEADMTATATADLDTLKARLKATWMDGNYDVFSRLMETSAVEFLDRLQIKPGAVAARRRVRLGPARR